MNQLKNEEKLNKVFNEIMDLVEKEGVGLEAFGTAPGPAALTIKEGGKVVDRLYFDYAKRVKAKANKPPKNFKEFLQRATDTFVKKNTDYGDRYTKALMEEGAVIWRWEVDKKIDRIRSWVGRGELLVKDEGVDNSVQDLFNYTVMYIMHNRCILHHGDPLKNLTEEFFHEVATSFQPFEWVQFLENKGRIGLEETEVRAIILKYMGAGNE